MHQQRLFIFLLAFHLGVASGFAQQAELIADLNQAPEVQGSEINSWVRASDQLFFFRALRDLELWRTDGTSAGTVLVRALSRSQFSEELIGTELADGRLLFVANDLALGRELWVSDGTSVGTYLYADLCAGDCDSNPGSPTHPAARGDAEFLRWGDEVVFAAEIESGETRLFAADGSAPPRLLSELQVERWGLAGDQILILERPEIDGPWRLWVTDGSPQGEHLVQELPMTFVRDFRSFRSGMLLVAQSGEDFSVYYGNEEGLTLIFNSAFIVSEPGIVVGPSVAYLLSSACRIFRIDGSAGGAIPSVFEVDPDTVGLRVGRCNLAMGMVDDRIFFRQQTTQTGTELWTSDGTVVGTHLVKDLYAGAELSELSRWTTVDGSLADGSLAGGSLFFLASGPGGRGLWRTDGSASGTEEIRAFRQFEGPFGSSDRPLGLLDSRVVFAAELDLDQGLEIWASDGTRQGTTMLGHATPDEASSNPDSFFGSPNDIFFRTATRVPEEHREILRIDTEGSVVPLLTTLSFADLLGRSDARVFVATTYSQRFGPTLIEVIDAASGEVTAPLEIDISMESTVVDDQLYVVSGGFEGSSPREIRGPLYTTDGTAEGTSRLYSPGGNPANGGLNPYPLNLRGFRGDLFFANLSDSSPPGSPFLWRSDGTARGTQRVRDIRPDGSLRVGGFSGVAGDRLFLTTVKRGDVVLLTLGPDLRVEHEVKLADGMAPFSSVGPRPVAFQGSLVWLSRTAAPGPKMLWISDGTAAGTRTLATFSNVNELVVSGDRIFLSATTLDHGEELWVSDGSAAGTRLVRDLDPGPASSGPNSLRPAGSALIFSARTPDTGVEAWISDGTSEGTRLLADVNPGPASSRPAEFTVLGDRVYFAAFRPDVGRELFAIDRSALAFPCVQSEKTLCLSDERFSVRVDWADFVGLSGAGQAVPLTTDTGYFWFFDEGNVEAVIKVLDGCVVNDRFWVFAAGLTNVGVTVTVTDTLTSATKVYRNGLGAPFAPVQDTSAFEGCSVGRPRPAF